MANYNTHLVFSKILILIAKQCDYNKRIESYILSGEDRYLDEAIDIRKNIGEKTIKLIKEMGLKDENC